MDKPKACRVSDGVIILPYVMTYQTDESRTWVNIVLVGGYLLKITSAEDATKFIGAMEKFSDTR